VEPEQILRLPQATTGLVMKRAKQGLEELAAQPN
jgi:hypothetical protein